MKPLNASSLASPFASFPCRLLSLGVAGALALAPLPAVAASATEPAAETDPSPAATVGGVVALLRFSGDAAAGAGMREKIQNALTAYGYTVKGVRKDMEGAAAKNKCKTVDDACLAKVGAYLNKNAKTPFNFFVYGEAAGVGGQSKVVVYDIDKGERVEEFKLTVVDGDYMLADTFPYALARATAEHQVPAPELSAAEIKIIEELDEPKKTQAQIDAENQAIADGASAAGAGLEVEIEEQPVDLRADFKDFCRTGPREDTESQNSDGTVDIQRDMRPVCKRGPVRGYWQPRSHVAVGLTIVAAASTGLMYGLALASKSEWKDAKKALDASGYDGSTPDQNDCTADPDGCYPTLAGAVSEAGYNVRRRAILGDVLLGTTVLLGGVLAIILYQDRSAAKNWMRAEKELRLSNIRVGPMLADQGGGMSAGFNF